MVEQKNNNGKLRNIKWLDVFGNIWRIGYNCDSGQLHGLKRMMQTFNVKSMDTIVFSIDEHNDSIIVGKIYEKDGMEMKYSKVLNKISYGRCPNWFMNIHWNVDSGMYVLITINSVNFHMVNDT